MYKACPSSLLRDTHTQQTDLVEFLVEGARVLHVLHLVGPLTLVGRDDPNLLRLDPGAQEASHQLLRVGRLRPATGTHGVKTVFLPRSKATTTG